MIDRLVKVNSGSGGRRFSETNLLFFWKEDRVLPIRSIEIDLRIILCQLPGILPAIPSFSQRPFYSFHGPAKLIIYNQPRCSLIYHLALNSRLDLSVLRLYLSLEALDDAFLLLGSQFGSCLLHKDTTTDVAPRMTCASTQSCPKLVLSHGMSRDSCGVTFLPTVF